MLDGFRYTNSRCPVDVTEECPVRCGRRDPARPERSCRWPAFGCDFQICREPGPFQGDIDIFNLLLDSRAYALEGMGTPYGGVNFISLVRLTQPGSVPGLYLIGGRFVLEVPSIARAAATRPTLAWAQRCAMTVKGGDADEQHQRYYEQRMSASERGGVFRVSGCSDGGVRLDPYTPPPPRAPRPAAPEASGTKPPVPSGGARNAVGEIDRLRALDDGGLESHLERNPAVRVDGNRILVDGIVPFSPSTQPEEQMRALANVSDEDRAALKEMYMRLSRRAVEQAERREPAGEGEEYVYDPDTGGAELEASPDGGGGDIKDPPPGGADPRGI